MAQATGVLIISTADFSVSCNWYILARISLLSLGACMLQFPLVVWFRECWKANSLVLHCKVYVSSDVSRYGKVKYFCGFDFLEHTSGAFLDVFFYNMTIITSTCSIILGWSTLPHLCYKFLFLCSSYSSFHSSETKWQILNISFVYTSRASKLKWLIFVICIFIKMIIILGETVFFFKHMCVYRSYSREYITHTQMERILEFFRSIGTSTFLFSL